MQLQSTIIDDLAGNLNNSKINPRLYQSESIYDGINTFTELEEMFDALEGPSIYNFFNDDELALINKIIRDPIDRAFKKKFQKLDAIVKPKGFKRSGCGTNRVLYEPLDDNATFCIKIALDKAGAKNSPDEIVNQKYLKPFVTKCFDISQDGNVGIFERVVPIENLYQLWSIRDDVYKIMESIVGRFIIDDFGTKAFKNWGLRKGFGPVLLDYADMYILDPKILYCTHTISLESTEQCRGELDYDAGFNNIICLKCGGIHMASEYKEGRKKIAIYARKREVDMNFKVEIFKGDTLYWDNLNGFNNTEEKTPVYNEPDISNQIQLEELDKAKKELAKSESDLIKSENKLKEQVKVINIGAINPAKPRINKLYAPKPERPARDLENTMHSKALAQITDDKKEDQNIEIDLPKVIETDVDNDTVIDNKVIIDEKESNELKQLIHEEIKPLGNFIKEIADDIVDVYGTDDEFSYKEILEFDKAFESLIIGLDKDKVINIHEYFPEVFLDSNVKDDTTVSIATLRSSIGEDLEYVGNAIYDLRLRMESDMVQEDEEYTPKAPRRRAKIGRIDNY